MDYDDVAIIIPSRLDSTRLPQKALKYIGSRSMIEHVINQAMLTRLGNIFVATDSEIIAEKVRSCNAEPIITSKDCPSGTDRVFEAFKLINGYKQIDYIINLQGDMPFIEASTIKKVIDSLKTKDYDIITPVVKMRAEGASDSHVKVVVDKDDRAIYFSRSLIPFGAVEYLHHIGIYGFRKKSLEKFVSLPVSSLERLEKLEQLRAIENQMTIGICYVDNFPIAIDTEDDYNKALAYYIQKEQR